MGALNALARLVERRSLEDPNVPITSAALASVADLWGPAAGDSDDPYSIGTFFRCVQIISATVAGLPLRATQISNRHEIVVPALRAPRLVDGGYALAAEEVIETATSHLVCRGNAYIRKWRDRTGRVVQLVPVHPSHVQVRASDADRRTGRPLRKRFIVDGDEELTERDIMHIHTLSDDGVMGMSVIARAARTLRIAANTEQTAMRLARAGRPNGVLSTDKTVNAEQAKTVSDAFVARLGTASNEGRPLVLGQGLAWTALDLSPEDMQFLEQRRFSKGEIAALLGMPGWMVGDRDKTSAWGTGMEQEFRSWVAITIKPLVQRIERRLAIELLDPYTQKAEFALEGLLRGDSQARAAFYTSMITNGAMTPNEIRELEDLPPVEWGNEPYLPYNTPASQTTKDDANAST